MHIYYLTKEKFEELNKECENLKKIQRNEFSVDAPSLLEGEDLNPEYTAYQEHLEEVASRVAELENVLKNCKIISKPIEPNKVDLGASVVLENGSAQLTEFKIVGTLEANPFEGKISNESPVGMSFLGKEVGETISIGSCIYKILNIKYEEC